jgi:hypothetical protein
VKGVPVVIVPAVLNLGEIVFAVVGSRTGEPTKLTRPDVYGTAFCVGPATFITAGHVVRSVEADGGVVTLVAVTNDGPMAAAPAARTEIIEGYDLAVVACMVDRCVPILDWQTSPLPLLADVSTVGFPYAVSSDEKAFWVSLRGLKGSVITRRKLWSLSARPVGYEVSCRFPKGLSGAPLLASASGALPLLRLAGVVIGTGTAEIDGEVSEFGEAVDVSELSEVKSVIVGGSLGDLREVALKSMPTGTADFTKPILEWPRKSR